MGVVIYSITCLQCGHDSSMILLDGHTGCNILPLVGPIQFISYHFVLLFKFSFHFSVIFPSFFFLPFYFC